MRSSIRSDADSRLPGCAAGRERRRLQGRAAPARRGAARPRPTSRRSARSPMSPRSSARTAPSPGSDSSDCGRRRGRVSPPCSSAPGSLRPAVDLDTIAFALAPRLNAAGRVGEALEAARLLLAETAEEARDPRRCARDRQPDATRPDGHRRRRGPRARRRRTRIARRRSSAAPWPVGIIGLVAARLAEDRARPAVVGTELGDTIRASCRSDGTVDLARPRSRSAPTSSRATAATPAPPASSSRRRAGRSSSSGSRRSPRRASRRTRGPSCASISPCRALDVDYRLLRELGGLRRTVRATPSRSSRSSV